jgi:glutamine---fructose-6-phosphate transaminase (isomerizing)
MMLKEALEAPEVVASQLVDAASPWHIAEALAATPVRIALTVARGSSDHAAAYFASVAMSKLGIPVASLPMSVMTHQRARLKVEHSMALAFSQSGKSPDLVETMALLCGLGARSVAVVNETASPLAAACDSLLPVLAGQESSVAATKSYIGMLSRSAQLVAHWLKASSGDASLCDAINALPEALHDAGMLDWSHAVDVLAGVDRMLVIGRGAGLALALEAALKLKETSGIQAEAFSSAEVRHGPMELIDKGYPLLVFALPGPEQAGLLQFASDMRSRGATVLLAAPDGVERADLTVVAMTDPVLNAIPAALSFYVMAAQLAEARGRDPDQPRHLKKVTETH